jgi:hypothetical protein
LIFARRSLGASPITGGIADHWGHLGGVKLSSRRRPKISAEREIETVNII